MKKFAFYLPQFHEIPENDQWWGKGFTEWTNVKAAQQLFKGHDQPLKPLNNNYYNLLDRKIIEWQTDLMHQYKLDGLIYYHYYFNGKLLLEKPAENLLASKDINQPFFFCWANHSWSRTWDGTQTTLIEQEYGDQEDWEKHFQYLLPFFKDSRYEKKGNQPLFMIFKSDNKVLKNIFEYFDKRCKEEGFDGIYLIESYHGENFPSDFSPTGLLSVTKKVYIREPAFSNLYFRKRTRYLPQRFIRSIRSRLNKNGILKKPIIYNGNKMYDIKIKYEPDTENIIHGISFEWDNTPRHKSRGYIITPVSRSKLVEYVNHINQKDYIFINAWNEWAEGMVLEPTTKNQYRYLEWVRDLDNE